MDWNDLKYVLTIAKTGKISECAKILEVNATTVTRRLKAIEERFQVRVFEKTKGGISLTLAGKEMLQTAEQMEALTYELDSRVSGMDMKMEGSIRITTADVLLDMWMDDFILFNQRYKDVELELITSYSLANLSNREADVAIRIVSDLPPTHSN